MIIVFGVGFGLVEIYSFIIVRYQVTDSNFIKNKTCKYSIK